MPANLTPQYHKAEQRYKDARTPEERAEALREMLSVIPKHKGTEHLQADIKRRLSLLRREGEKKGGPKRVASPYAIGKAGAGQVVVIGPPNSGKSALVGAVSHAPVVVAEHPFATTAPVPGMMIFDSIRIQIVDTPPILRGVCDPELAQLLGRADLAVLCLSAGDPEVLDQIEAVGNELAAHHLALVEDPELSDDVAVVGGAVKAMIVVTGLDRPDATAGFDLLRELIGDRLPILTVQPITGEGLDHFRWTVWQRLRAVRVFCKLPGKKPDLDEPFFLREGETVQDFAAKIHRDLARTFKQARLWGEGVHDGQPVPRDHVLHDGEVVELHH